MSYTFSIHTTELPPAADLFERAGFPGVLCQEEVDLTQSLPEGTFHFYRKGISCRTVEVTREGESFEVRLMAHSSRDDYALGLGLVEAVARERKATIHSEDGEEFGADELADQHGAEWIDEMIRSAFGMFNMVLNQGGTAQINGAVRPLTVGPDLLAELGFQSGPEEFASRFFAKFRSLQWMDLDDCFQASVMVVTPQDSSEQRRVSSVGAPGLRYLLQKVDFITVQPDGELLFVPWDRLAEAFGDRFQRLDENLVIVEPISAAEWASMTEQLQTVAVPFC